MQIGNRTVLLLADFIDTCVTYNIDDMTYVSDDRALQVMPLPVLGEVVKACLAIGL